MAGCEGGSWDGIEENWDLIRYQAMVDHWERNGPPVYMTVAAYFGLVKKPKEKAQKTGDLNELLARFPSGRIN
jgi:hypothetical protein